MKKEELMNGSIVVTRGGYLGVVIRDEDDGYILYQKIGIDDLADFNDDLTSKDGEDWDIMEVYGDRFNCCSFRAIDHDDPNPVWFREYDWHHPTAEEREAREAEWEKKRLQMVEEMRRQEEARMREVYISVITQCCLGSRAKVQITRDDVKRFISNILAPVPDSVFSDMELRTITVPGDKNIVIVYDKTREDEYLNGTLPEYYDDYRRRPGVELPKETCSIPEIGVELHTRCLACRIDENGVFQSLEDGDEEKFIDYFPVWWEREKPTKPRYRVGDMVELTADRRGFDEIEGHGKVDMVVRDRYDGRNKYLVECYNNAENRYQSIAFYDDEIVGLYEED